MPDRITIHLHIGAGKTGSTSIQHMLRVMSAELLQQGYLVFNQQFQPHASPDHDCEQQTYFNNLITKGEEGPIRFSQQMQRNLAYMRKHNIKHAIISAECLMNYWCNFSRYFEDFVDEVDWQIIAYVRNQPEFLLSSWKQWGHFINTDFENWLNTNIGMWGNWLHHLAEWDALFGSNRIRIGILDKRFMVNGNLLTDFLHIIGCTPISFPDTLTQTVNASPNNRALQVFEYVRDNDYIRAVRSQYYADPDQGQDFDEHTITMRRTMTDVLPSYKNLIIRNAPHHGLRITDPNISYFTQPQLDTIYNTYKDSNHTLITRYKPDIDATLAFPALSVAQTIHMTDSELVHYTHQLFFEIINSMDQRQQYLGRQIKRFSNNETQYVLRSEYEKLQQQITLLEQRVNDTWITRLLHNWQKLWRHK